MCILQSFQSIDLIVGLRLPKEAELQGCDTHEHGMKPGIDKSLLGQFADSDQYKNLLKKVRCYRVDTRLIKHITDKPK